MSSVRSVAYQEASVIASKTANSAVESAYGTWNWMCSASAHIVPNTATIDTASQYSHVWYRRARNWAIIAMAHTTKPMNTARYWLRSAAIVSETASPIAVVSSLAIQK